MLEPLHGLGRSVLPSVKTGQPQLLDTAQTRRSPWPSWLSQWGRACVGDKGPRTESPAWSVGSSFPGKEALDLSGHHGVDMGGAQLSVFQAQGTTCARVPGPWD